jgi:hypothetical protein
MSRYIIQDAGAVLDRLRDAVLGSSDASARLGIQHLDEALLYRQYGVYFVPHACQVQVRTDASYGG